MKTLKITKKDLDFEGYFRNHNLFSETDIEIPSGLNFKVRGSITSKGSVHCCSPIEVGDWINVGQDLVCSEDVKVPGILLAGRLVHIIGDLRAGCIDVKSELKVSGNLICSDGIVSHWSILCKGKIVSGGEIRAVHAIKAGDSIQCRSSILTDSSISSGGSISASIRIAAGLGIFASGSVSAGHHIAAGFHSSGDMPEEERAIRCEKIRGKVWCGFVDPAIPQSPAMKEESFDNSPKWQFP